MKNTFIILLFLTVLGLVLKTGHDNKTISGLHDEIATTTQDYLKAKDELAYSEADFESAAKKIEALKDSEEVLVNELNRLELEIVSLRGLQSDLAASPLEESPPPSDPAKTNQPAHPAKETANHDDAALAKIIELTAQQQALLKTADEWADELEEREREWKRYDRNPKGVSESEHDRNDLRKKVKAAIHRNQQQSAKIDAAIATLKKGITR